MSQGFGTPPQTAQSGSNVFIQADSPEEGEDGWVWYPIDETGTWDGTVQVYAPGAPTVPNFTVDPAITGTALVGSTLTCDGGTVSGNPTPAKTYQWKRAGTNISGATASTYVLVSGDVASAITCTVTATNSEGSDSAASNAITPVVPANSVAPAVTGSAVTGQTLTCSTGTWSGSPTYAYQWKRAGSAISGATSSTYVLQVADESQSVKCTVTATNANGSASADSNTVTPSASPTAPGAPTSLILTPGDTSIAAAWTAPASNGGSAITTYLVEYRTPNGSGSYTTFTHSASTTPSIAITGLTNGSAYGVRVSAVNAVGTGSPTSEGTATPVSAGLPYTTGLLIDWNADDVAGANNSTPTTIADSSGNSRDGTIAGGTLKTAVTAFNGHRAIELSGTASHIIHDAVSAFLTGATFTLVLVGTRRSVTNQECLAILHKTNTDDYLDDGNYLVMSADADNSLETSFRSGVTRASLAASGDNVPFIFTTAVSSSGADRARRIAGGTVNATPTAASPLNFEADQLIVGRRFFSGALAKASHLTVARVLLFSGDLSGGNQSATEAYLSTLYGVS